MAVASVELSGVRYALSYELLHPEKSECVLILHGWGANKELMKQAFAGEFANFCHIYIDLCGFGKSTIEVPLKSTDYAQIVAAFLRQKKLAPALIIGHSFGGKIATLLSKDFTPKILVLLSSAGIVWQKSFKVRAKIALFKAFKGLGLSKFRTFFASKDVKGMNATMYETFKNVVDEDFSAIFSEVVCQTLIFWGDKDKATPLKSGEKIHALIKNSEFYALDGEHFFFLQHAPFIAKCVLDTLSSKESQ